MTAKVAQTFQLKLPGTQDLALSRWLEIRNENPLELSLIGVAYTSRGGSELQSK
jgi:hypothetical protein